MNETAQKIVKPVKGEENPQNSTEIEAVFDPTPHMLKWLEKAMELGHTASITDVAKESGVDRTNWYIWTRNPKFVEWWDNQWQSHLRVNRWKLDAIGMKQATSDYSYWKAMMERTGNLQPEGFGVAQQFNIGGAMTLDFIKDGK